MPDVVTWLLYDYNQRNLLVEHSTMVLGVGVETLAQFVYDGDGNRLQQLEVTGNVTTTITYTNDILGLSQVLVSDDGTTQTTNLFGLDLISQDDSTETRYLLPDGLGSVRVEMVGSTVETATTYAPYGSLLARTGSSGTIYGFTGEQHDGATGFIYLRARYYSPDRYIFISRDPYTGQPRIPSTLHGYSYAHNNPIRLTDPSGKVVKDLHTGNAYYTNNYLNSECCQFVKDVEYIINEGLSSNLPEWAIVGILAQYYANINATETFHLYISAPSSSLSGWGCFNSTMAIPLTIAMPFPISRGTPTERHPIYDRAEHDPNAMMDFMNRNADQMRAIYGFKRPYFQNTHHYFAAFILSYAYGSKLGTKFSGMYDERGLLRVKNAPNFPTPRNYDPTIQAHRELTTNYEALWLDIFTDFYVNETAAKHALIVYRQGIAILPQLIKTEMCAISEADVWSLQHQIYLSGNYEPASDLAPWWANWISTPVPPWEQ